MAQAIDNAQRQSTLGRSAEALKALALGAAAIVALAVVWSASAKDEPAGAARANPRQPTVVAHADDLERTKQKANGQQKPQRGEFDFGPPIAPPDREKRDESSAVASRAVPSSDKTDLGTSRLTNYAADPDRSFDVPGSIEENNRQADESIDASKTQSLPLGARGDESRQGGAANGGSWLAKPIGQTLVALAIVVGLIFLLWTVFRRTAGRIGGLAAQLGPAGQAPSGVLSVLARYPVARGQTLVLLQMDRRLLLLCQTQQGFQTLCEVTDPEEVASLITRAQDDEGRSLSQRFSRMLRGFERDPSIVGDVEADADEARGPRSMRAVFEGQDESIAQEPATLDRRDARPTDPVGSLRRRLHSMREASA